jgi:hypothetical protein
MGCWAKYCPDRENLLSRMLRATLVAGEELALVEPLHTIFCLASFDFQQTPQPVFL